MYGHVPMVLVVLLVVLLVLCLPQWPYSRPWGYYPSGIAGVLVVILIVLLLLGYV